MSLDEIFENNRYDGTITHYTVKKILFGADDTPEANAEFEKLLKSGKLKPVPGTNAYRKTDIVNLIKGREVERKRLMERFEKLLTQILTEIKKLREDIGVVRNEQREFRAEMRMREKEPKATR